MDFFTNDLGLFLCVNATICLWLLGAAVMQMVETLRDHQMPARVRAWNMLVGAIFLAAMFALTPVSPIGGVQGQWDTAVDVAFVQGKISNKRHSQYFEVVGRNSELNWFEKQAARFNIVKI